VKPHKEGGDGCDHDRNLVHSLPRIILNPCGNALLFDFVTKTIRKSES
jgi:hypothetical protein